jgi:glutamate dehydrogenase
MAVRPEELEAALIETVCSRMREQAPAELIEQGEAFVRQYYHWVPQDDLAGRSPADLYAAALGQLQLLRARVPGEIALRVYNPDRTRDGWASPNTVVEIVTDDMPFLVDSVSMALTGLGYRIHLMIHPVVGVTRDAEQGVARICPLDAPGAVPESVMHVEIDRETDGERTAALERTLRGALEDVAAAVEDGPAIVQRALDAAAELEGKRADETRAFLEWLADEDRFLFLGYREYGIHGEAVEGSGLGILRSGGDDALSAGPEESLVLTKGNSRSTVQRPSYLDYVGVKRFDASGAVIGERRFLGLYTTAASKASPLEIPVLRGKVEAVARRAAFPPESHDAKALLEIIENYPRAELFQIDEDTLFEFAMGILALGERPRLRLFMRRDPYGRFASCLIYLPRDRFNTDSRMRIADVLRDELRAETHDWTVLVSESALVRLQFTVHLTPDSPTEPDAARIEARLGEVSRSWTEDLAAALRDAHGDRAGNALFRRYRDAFPPAYRADTRARAALDDIALAEQVAQKEDVDIRVSRPADGTLHCKLFSPGTPIQLSTVVPIFENLGARVADERPYEVRPSDTQPVWIYDFGLASDWSADTDTQTFKDAFLGVWRNELENDSLGRLVGSAALSGRQVSLLRAAVKYLRQAGTTFSDRYVRQSLTDQPHIARLLVELFEARFDPDGEDERPEEILVAEIEDAIDAVRSLDQDRLLRGFLSIFRAVVRTNYYVRDRAFLSFKLDSSQLSFLPSPRPRFEIFVYSPRVEGVHLRGGKVARGGVRWSDRREDFRTEILGLMKAQMLKNALIVPVGAKGGFVVKRPPPSGGRQAHIDEAVACYSALIRGMLDVTDNLVEGTVVPPERVVRHDGDDTYLVVAADKGTATLSDLANEIAGEYGFWLGDAFASGGSHGYDHKAMGITARGAWECVTRHFRELGVDPQAEDFTVVGIGGMAGDVFGNGMLLSPHIRLVGAFDHQHVFIDPDPDAARGFGERRRLFEQPGSTWQDYDPELISPGGGVFARAAKHVALSSEARAALGIDAERLTPAELIRALLRAPVDLLWNGGIGTFVKSSSESNADVGDKANDALRVDADGLRCRVIGEGGNLGLTQRARIEYALAGGLVNTDAIDNVAGVSCSDDEVNLKILLDSAVADGELTVDERNDLLRALTDDVAARVLGQSYAQALGLSLERASAPQLVDLHVRLLRSLERAANLDRKLEFLPSDEEIEERKRAGKGLTAPELSLLFAYTKNTLHGALVESDVTDEDFLADQLVDSFPPPLPERFRDQMRHHPLRGDIIATHLANEIVDRGGATFAFRVAEEDDVPAADVARAYMVALAAFDVRSLWAAIEGLDGRVDAGVQYGMLFDVRRLVGRATRWLVNDARRPIDIEASIGHIAPSAAALGAALPDILNGAAREAWDARVTELVTSGVPRELAVRAASAGPLFAALDVAEIAGATGHPLDTVATAYLELSARLSLQALGDRILELPRSDLIETLARAGLRDDLYQAHRELTAEVLRAGGLARWLDEHAAELQASASMLADIDAAGVYDVTTLSVALRAVWKLIPRPDPARR